MLFLDCILNVWLWFGTGSSFGCGNICSYDGGLSSLFGSLSIYGGKWIPNGNSNVSTENSWVCLPDRWVLCDNKQKKHLIRILMICQ